MQPVLTDKDVQPEDKIIESVLGTSYKYYSDFHIQLHKEFPGLREEWKYYGPKSGWTMKCFRKNRNLFFLTPYKNSLNIAFLFGEKAVNAIQNGQFRKELVDELLSSKKYVEGRVLRLELNSGRKISEALKLILIKINS